MKATGRRILFAGLIIFLLGAAGAYRLASRQDGDTALSFSIPGIIEPRVRPQPLLEKHYRYCGHREPLPLPTGVQWRWAGREELSILFPPAEGWRIVPEENRLVVVQEVDSLCPADAPKRHLAVKDGRVAVYQGPPGSLGPLLRVTNLEFAALPPPWREKIAAGEAGFDSEQELLAAMDSLDEFRP